MRLSVSAVGLTCVRHLCVQISQLCTEGVFVMLLGPWAASAAGCSIQWPCALASWRTACVRGGVGLSGSTLFPLSTLPLEIPPRHAAPPVWVIQGVFFQRPGHRLVVGAVAYVAAVSSSCIRMRDDQTAGEKAMRLASAGRGQTRSELFLWETGQRPRTCLHPGTTQYEEEWSMDIASQSSMQFIALSRRAELATSVWYPLLRRLCCV